MNRYGGPPFRVAVIHGGPGAAGDMAPVARVLSGGGRGVLEPLQTATSVDGQIEELRAALAAHAPVALVGHSWGAWLACLLAAAHRDVVSRLVLVSSGPFEDKYVPAMRETRLGRLSAGERAEFDRLLARGSVAALGALLSKADDYDAVDSEEDDAVDVRVEVFHGVWPEAAALRASGELLARTARIRCPVAAIHGDYDAHPVAGVREPLARVLPGFEMVELAHCGHTPWRERQARDAFFRALERLLSTSGSRSA